MEAVMKVEGMSCNHCKMSVEKAAKSVATVAEASVDLQKGELSVSFSGDQLATLEALKSAITDAGFDPV